MVGSTRRGGFGSPSLTGPFQIGGGDFSRYSIADTGADIAYLDKLRAQTAWQNGQLTDEGYLSALRAYVASTDGDSTRRVSAQNELDDAIYSIGRNKLVRAVNGATTDGGRVRELLRLIRYDRTKLGTMSSGDNEQRREMVDRIAGLQVEVRTARWSRIHERYQNGRMSTEEMIAEAQRFARMSSGKTDHSTYKSYVRGYNDRHLDEQLGEALSAWADDPKSGQAKAADALLAKKIARYKPGSPQHKQAVDARQDFKEKVNAYNKEMEYVRMESRYRAGGIDDMEWLDFMRKRLGDEDKGTPGYIRARDQLRQTGDEVTEKLIKIGMLDGTHTAGDLVDFYSSQLFLMDPANIDAQELQAEISALRAQSAGNFGTSAAGAGYAGASGGGHVVYPGDLAPGGRPVNRKGFASQFDGSPFASTNCGMASAAMLAWAVSGGKTKVSGGDMRFYSGDREGGTWTDDMTRALDGVGINGRAFHNMSLADFRKKIDNGKPAVLTGTSGMLPQALRIGGYTGAHSVYVDRMKKHNGKNWYFVLDPLGRGGYKGKWWDEGSLKAYGWDGKLHGTSGSAVFAGKGGHTKKKLKKDESPPPQAFDTDWTGAGLQGKGGGVDREEAGPPQDWSEGRPTMRGRSEKYTGTDEKTVQAFLAAVGKTEARRRTKEQAEGRPGAETVGVDDAEDMRWNRAVELLEGNGGDPRLAAVEWFTGIRVTGDVTNWSQSARYYANSVAKPMGLAKVKKGDVLQPGAPEQPISPDLTGAPPTAAGGPPGTAEVAPQPIGVPADVEAAARGILERLGVVPQSDTLRTMVSWIMAENGGGDVTGNNPLNLIPQSKTQMPGQIGILEDGTANFDTLEEGLDAMADIIERDGDGLVPALRANDPQAFARALKDAKWSEDPSYGNLVTQKYNELPGVTRVVSNVDSALQHSPTSLIDATKGVPQLAELQDVDPFDPNQMAWFAGNVDRAEEAAKAGAGTWIYESPDGEEHKVAMEPGIITDALQLNLEYVTSAAPTSSNGWKDTINAAKRLDNTSEQVDFRSLQRFTEAGIKQRDAAVLRGDYTYGWEIEKDLARRINVFMGFPPDGPLDVNIHQNSWLTDNTGALEWVRRTIDTLEPRGTENPTGSRLGQLVRDKTIIVQQDPDGGPDMLFPDPEKMFHSIGPDGRPVIHDATTDPEAFKRVGIMGPDGRPGGDSMPRYQSPESGWTPMALSNGMTGWVQPRLIDSSDDASLFGYFNVEYEGASREAALAAAQSQVAQPGGPANLLFDILNNRRATGGSTVPSGPQTAAHQAPPAVEPDALDGMLVPAGIHLPGQPGHPPIWVIDTYDIVTGAQLTGFSLDGPSLAGGKWLWQLGERTGSPPALVMKQAGARSEPDPETNIHRIVLPDGTPVEGDWGKYIGFYGDDTLAIPRSAGDSESIGAPGQAMVLRSQQPVEAGGRLSPINASFNALDYYHAGAVTPAEGERMARQERQAFRQWLDAGGEEALNAMAVGEQQLNEELMSGMPDALKRALATRLPTQLTGPGASQSMHDPQLTSGMQAQAAGAEALMAEEQDRLAAQRAEAERQAAVKPKPTPVAPTPSPTTAKPTPTPTPTPRTPKPTPRTPRTPPTPPPATPNPQTTVKPRQTQNPFDRGRAV